MNERSSAATGAATAAAVTGPATGDRPPSCSFCGCPRSERLRCVVTSSGVLCERCLRAARLAPPEGDGSPEGEGSIDRCALCGSREVEGASTGRASACRHCLDFASLLLDLRHCEDW